MMAFHFTNLTKWENVQTNSIKALLPRRLSIEVFPLIL